MRHKYTILFLKTNILLQSRDSQFISTRRFQHHSICGHVYECQGLTHVYFLDMDYTVIAGYFSMHVKTFQLDLRKNQMISCMMMFLHICKSEIFFPTLIRVLVSACGYHPYAPLFIKWSKILKSVTRFKSAIFIWMLSQELNYKLPEYWNTFSEDMIEPFKTDIIIIMPCKLYHFKE